MKNKNTDKVSIIIPTHNRLSLLKRALDSCKNQTYTNVEIIVVNDGSTDGTENYLDSLFGIIAIHNVKAMGGPYSRNCGAQKASGKYISFLDDDDELMPEKVEKQVYYFENHANKKTGILTCDMLEIRTQSQRIIENRKKGTIHKDLLSKYCVQGIHTMLIKKEIFDKVGGFDTRLLSNQEYDLMIQMAKYGEYEYLPEVLVKVYIHELGQISTNFKKKRNGTISFIKKNQNEYKKYGIGFYLLHMARLSTLVVIYELSNIFGIRFYRLIFP